MKETEASFHMCFLRFSCGKGRAFKDWMNEGRDILSQVLLMRSFCVSSIVKEEELWGKKDGWFGGRVEGKWAVGGRYLLACITSTVETLMAVPELGRGGLSVWWSLWVPNSIWGVYPTPDDFIRHMDTKGCVLHTTRWVKKKTRHLRLPTDFTTG